MTIKLTRVFAYLLLALLSACSTTPTTTSPSTSAPVDDLNGSAATTASAQKQNNYEPAIVGTVPDTASASVVEPLPSKQEPIQQSPAVLALLGEAQRASSQGNFQSAQNSLQRAQRISPKDPQIYYELAQTHTELESYALAEQVALKGASLAQNNRLQSKKFWQLITEIRILRGDIHGAEQAEIKAANY